MISDPYLRERAIEFLLKLPNIHSVDGRQALLYTAGLDSSLMNQIDFSGPSVVFCSKLVRSLDNYGKLADGRYALEAVLWAGTQWVPGTELERFGHHLMEAWHARQTEKPTNRAKGGATSMSSANEEIISILFLASDPTDASRLRLGEEFRQIQERLKLAKLRERFRLELPRLSVRPEDVSQALLDTQPQIVHFSGHGTSDGALSFENQVGEAHPVQPDALSALFEQFAEEVNCVVLNACYSHVQATAIAQHIDYVVGMNQAIADKAAIAFAIGFYQALGAGRSIEGAYKLGCVQIGLQGIPEHLTPVLIEKGQAPSKHEEPSQVPSPGEDPLDVFAALLDEPANWIKVKGDKYIRHRYHPQFVIQEGKAINEDYREPWAQRFPDPHASSFEVEYLYESTLLKASLFIATDGGRFSIPAPQLHRFDPDREDWGGIEFRISTSSLEWKTAMLFDQYDDLRDRLPRTGVNLVE